LYALGSAYVTQSQIGENPSQSLSTAIKFDTEAEQIQRNLGWQRDLEKTLDRLYYICRQFASQRLATIHPIAGWNSGSS
jgi:hypothetical protein